MNAWPKPRKNEEKAKENTLAFLPNRVHGLVRRRGEAAHMAMVIEPDLAIP